MFDGQWPILTLLDRHGDTFITTRTNKLNGGSQTLQFYYYIGEQGAMSSGRVPLVFPHQWLRSCLAVSTQSGLLRWVVDGVLVEERLATELKENAEKRPTNLTGRVLLGTYKHATGWTSPGTLVTNLNIFSSVLPLERMVRMTSGGGEECGEEGDYLAWGEAQWTLHGEAAMEEVESMEPCEEEQRLNYYSAKFSKMEACMLHCEKLGSRAPYIANITEWKTVQSFLARKLFMSGPSLLWTSLACHQSVLRDFYNQNEIQQISDLKGVKCEGCLVQEKAGKWAGWPCDLEGKPNHPSCACTRTPRPYLYLRGLCSSSAVDTLYVRNANRCTC